jgi:heat shock protein HslJ
MKAIIFAALIACVALASCKTSKPTIGITSGSRDVDMLDGKWELTYISGPRIAFEGLYPDKKPTLLIDLANKKISGTTGCNSYNGPLVAENGHIDFTQPLAVTRMACGGKGVLGETTYLEMLKKITKYVVIDDNRLSLTAGGTTLMWFKRTELKPSQKISL